jgi:hypothetical protein
VSCAWKLPEAADGAGAERGDELRVCEERERGRGLQQRRGACAVPASPQAAGERTQGPCAGAVQPGRGETETPTAGASQEPGILQQTAAREDPCARPGDNAQGQEQAARSPAAHRHRLWRPLRTSHTDRFRLLAVEFHNPPAFAMRTVDCQKPSHTQL